MANCEVIVDLYYPSDVKRIIGAGGENYIGLVDDQTVLKYPFQPGQLQFLRIEEKFFNVLGSHPNIIRCMGMSDGGLLLEYAANGDIQSYLKQSQSPTLSQRLKWSRQIATGIAHAHTKRVIHRDIRLANVLLDGALDAKLADFQGLQLSADGKVLLDGYARECAKYCMPRTDLNYADERTDLFCLGSAISHIMTGQEIYLELDSNEDEAEIERRFQNGQFPEGNHICSDVVLKCWSQRYASVEELLKDIRSLEDSICTENVLKN